MRPRIESLEEREVPAQFGGVEFPQGISSFGDEVLFYRPVSTSSSTINPAYMDPSVALGAPDYPTSMPNGGDGSLTLGQGGQVGLHFTDNVLTNGASTDNDLWIFEVGPDVEASFISVRPTAATRSLLNPTLDADGFVAVGRIEGSTRGIDIDATFPGRAAGTLQFDAVKIVDDPNSGGGGSGSPGADIDSVGAIASAAVPAGVRITATDAQASEQGPGTATFTVSRTGSLSQPLTVQLGYTGTAVNGTDYQTLPASVTIPADSSSVNVVLTPINDTLVESTETAIATITSAAVPIDQTARSATAQIADNDTAPATVRITAPDPSATEQGPTTATFTVTRTGSLTQSLTVQLSYGGTAVKGTDYQNMPTSVTIPVGMASVNLVLTPINDTLAESTETAILTITSAAIAIDSTAKSATAQITDNDTVSVPTLALSALDPYASESVVGAASTGAMLLQRTSIGLSNTLAAVIQVAGTAKYGTDYRVTVSGGTVAYNATTSRLTVTFNASAAYVMVYVTPLNDLLDETVETVQLTLVTDARYLVNGTKKTGTVSVADNPLAGR